MTYTPYYLKFSSQEECDEKLTEVNYRHEEEYFPLVETTETDEDGNEIVSISHSTESEVRVYYSVVDDTGAPIGAIDIVGDVYNRDEVWAEHPDPETGLAELISPATKKDGWHVNLLLRGELPEELQEFVVNPEVPFRIFA